MTDKAHYYRLIRLFYGKEISQKVTFNPEVRGIKVNKPLLVKSLFVLLTVFGLFIYGVSYPFTALLGGALILLIGIVEPKFAFGEVNWTLLLFLQDYLSLWEG